jgi:hypothetical protein
MLAAMAAAHILDAHLAAIRALANQPRRDRGYTRAIYSYPAKFQAHLPAVLIDLFTGPGDLVVDPYAGGGTTGLEAYLAARPSLLCDLSPFACLVARVKTTPVALAASAPAAEAVLAATGRADLLDADEVACLGPVLADEVARLAGGIAALADRALADLLRLALIHTLKVAGRRDFAEPSLRPRFARTAARLGAAVAALPAGGPAPRVICASNASLPVDGGAARLVVTSPPYKDLDVEYGLLQIQRRALHRSKRSAVIGRLLGTPVLGKAALCGGRGDAYWRTLRPALAEIRRVLRAGAPAFLWTGFKTAADRARFEAELTAAGLPLRHAVAVTLGRDRVASSRSTHHGRDTGMLGSDVLFACTAA